MPYCADAHSSGWYCVLTAGHQGHHMSLDNSKLWKGTPGKPIFWGQELVGKEPDLNPTLTSGEIARAKALSRREQLRTANPTGDFCTEPGCSGMLVQMGSCKQCNTCASGGSCG